ncbi:TPA: helix-turn-helix transcriptional regulator [Clostridium perfringens]|uniref:helix-turn-helix domain-containing protein n=1 Tax=Clostridium perfringens TaxID=1502 RepID=UPI001B813DF6|nr:helix-turn-helix transcriptional regulator [Clostridium perfringens]MDH2475931.1 helix-turn-helix transcriptional regulator [Clostridium perfringens]MDU5492515.1 helix-turn-helix transcriptional regulator [Clostridium perfringens]HBC2028634.1 helix-turn-helix transcriptional regulator [Clostridium perfringens]HBC2031965.1 helix-turn-helix transcriptional regulator [Clostridium perfringens]HBC2055700.1 helix-turn-helix transcriptional regulator [Clostridium perfringens]
MINTLKIKARMVELGLTQKSIASEIGIAAPTISQKINNIRPMMLDEVEKFSEILKIRDDQFREYFFYNPVA